MVEDQGVIDLYPGTEDVDVQTGEAANSTNHAMRTTREALEIAKEALQGAERGGRAAEAEGLRKKVGLLEEALTWLTRAEGALVEALGDPIVVEADIDDDRPNPTAPSTALDSLDPKS